MPDPVPNEGHWVRNMCLSQGSQCPSGEYNIIKCLGHHAPYIDWDNELIIGYDRLAIYTHTATRRQMFNMIGFFL